MMRIFSLENSDLYKQIIFLSKRDSFCDIITKIKKCLQIDD